MSVASPNIDRLLAAFRHEKLDRVPNFEILIDSRTCSHILGRPDAGKLWNMDPSDALEIIQAVGQDALPCKLRYCLDDASICSREDMDRVETRDTAPNVERLRRYAQVVAGTPVGLCVAISGPLTTSYMTAGPVSIESFLYMLYDAPDLVARLMDHYTEYYLRLIDAIADVPFDFFYIGDDIGGTAGPLVSPAHLDEFWAPRMERYILAAKALRKPVLFHCCGNQSLVLPYLARWGVEAVHPIQPVANDIYAVHAEYGDRLTLVGNIDVATVLTFGTPEQVAESTREHIAKLSGDAGYVVASSHSIIDSVPPENYLAMVRAAHEYGVYA